jgi:hypothetical protein
MMDIALLTAFLSPFLPHLLNLGGKAAEKFTDTIAGKAGEAASTKATAIWAKLQPKVDAKESAREAADDVAKTPDDADAQAALRLQLKKILDSDPDLAAAIAQIMQDDAPDGTPGTQIVQHVIGNQNQVIGQVTGGNVFGNITGNVNL